MAQVNLSVPHSPTQKAGNFWRNFKPILPFLVLLILVVFAQTYFQQRQEIRSKAELPTLTVPVTQGADITDAVNAAIVQMSATGGTVMIPAGSYKVDALKHINLKSNVNLTLDPNTTLTAIPNSATNYGVVSGTGVSNVIIQGGTIAGERASHTGTTGEWGMVIELYGASNVTIKNLTVRDGWGDGIYAANNGTTLSSNITIDTVTATNNRRNGISFVALMGGHVINSKLIANKGTAPQAGLDLEPNAGQKVDNVVIEYTTADGNPGYGFLFYGGAAPVTNSVIRNSYSMNGGNYPILFHNGTSYCTSDHNSMTGNAQNFVTNLGTNNTIISGDPQLPSPTPSTKVLNVQSYGSVQKAVDAAQPGDSIYVPAGTWEGPVTLNGKSNLTIYGDGDTSVVQVTKSTDSIITIGGTGSSNIVIHDLKIKGAPFNSDNYQPGIEMSKLATGHFYNLRFESIGYAAINAANGEGDWTIDMTNIEVDHNTVVGPVGEHGFYVGRGSQYWNLHHNTVGQCIGYSQPPHAFYIQDSSYITVQYNNATDTTASNGFAYKFGQDIYPESVGKSHNNVCNYNTGNHNFGGIWVVVSNNFTARGNVITNNYNSAIQFYDVSNTAYIDGNDINPGMYGMQFIFNGLWGAGPGNPTNIHLTNNNLHGGSVWGCPNDICPSGMIVEQTNNSWQPGYNPLVSPTVTQVTPTPIPTNSPTPKPTSTPTPRPTNTPTPTPLPTSTPTPRPTATLTPTPLPTSTPTPRPTPTPTPSPTPVPTIPPTLVMTNTPTPAPLRFEAENATYYGAIFSKQNSGYTGTGYVDYQHRYNDYIQWTITVPTSGTYLLGFRYANGSWKDRPLQVKVNGITVNTGLSFPRTGKWTTWKYSQFVTNLNAGTNTIRLTAIGYSGPNIDNLQIVME